MNQKQKFYKIVLILALAAVLTALPVFWFGYSASEELEVDFLDVGQGDAALIKTPAGQNIIIDGGPDNAIIKALGENLPWWDKQIDLVILTHPHDDHLTGLIELIERFQVERILYSGVIHSSPNYLSWLESVRRRAIPLIIIERPQTINLGQQTKLEILYPLTSFLGQSAVSLNNSSIVFRLTFAETSFLFSGDIEAEAEQALLDRLKPAVLSADVLKVAHHGSDTSSSQAFLAVVRPRLAVIGVGADNDFGHPSPRVLKRLERIGAKILRTDLDGSISLVSDGQTIVVKP